MLMKMVAQQLAEAVSLTEEAIMNVLEFPPSEELGDVAFPCYLLSKEMKQSPVSIAQHLAGTLTSKDWEAAAAGPYVNFRFNRALASQRLLEAWNNEAVPVPNIGQGNRVIIDMSSPNIAKPFGIGHLRSTMIGNSLYHILNKVGYTAVSVNHLGDWGTQFGKQIVAYLNWGDPANKPADPIKAYLELYVRFHEEVEAHPELEDEARAWFAKLEAGDEEAKGYWTTFISDSMVEFQKLYDRLGVSFDHYLGESFYNDKMDAVVTRLAEQGLLEESDGAQVVRLDEYDLPPCIIKKSDGSSIYATRDLATAIYRHEVMQGSELLYVVGAEQSLHFRQLFLVLGKMGLEFAQQCKHIPFGLMMMDGQKMSTRRGKVVFLEDVLNEAVRHALLKIEEKNASLSNKLEVAEAVGIGAVVFGDLKHSRTLEVDFTFEDILSFEGETGPYVQYTYARTQSLLRKANAASLSLELSPLDYDYAEGDATWRLAKALMRYPDVLVQAAERYEPSVLARYLIDLAQTFNRFYHHEKILTDNAAERHLKLAFVQAAALCLADGLKLLGVQAPTEI